jgi:hypothetical protein
MAYGKVSGEVARIIDGYGFKLVEVLKNRDGSERKNWITVWSKDKVKVGDLVEVRGDISVKLEEYTGKDNVPRQSASMHFNNAEVKVADAPF